MDPASLKNQILHRNIQCILLNEKGRSIQSDDLLVKVPTDSSILDESEVFFGMYELIDALDIDEEFKLECVETEFLGRQSFYDFLIKRLKDVNAEKRYAVLIYDLEDVYRRVISLRQERNDAHIYADRLKSAHEKLKATQLQLIANEKMASVGLLAAGMSHEINNPLNYIFNGTALIKRNLNGSLDRDESVGQMLDIIEAGAMRIKDVVSQLKVFDATGHNEEKVVDIHTVIDHSIELIKHQLSDHTQIERKYATEPLHLRCRTGKMNQVLFNLLVNASNFTNKIAKPQISIETLEKGQCIHILIKDNGVGIPDSIKDQIFDPFFSTKELSTGKGLGLAVSKMIVKEHGGDLTFESEVGHGTTFCIQVPLATDRD